MGKYAGIFVGDALVMTKSSDKDNSDVDPLWVPTPDRVQNAEITAFMNHINKVYSVTCSDYADLWKWSVNNAESFWTEIWRYFDIIGDRGDTVLNEPDKMIGGQFFPDSKINYAENMLRRRDDKTAIIFRDETGGEQQLSFANLYDRVSLWQQAMIKQGVGEGDRVAGYMPNMPETIIAMLAAASLGAIWSSASPDFGAQGVIDRFGQIEPKILVAVDGYYYNGKAINCLEKIKEIQPHLNGLEKTVIVPFVNKNSDLSMLNNAVTENVFVNNLTPDNIEFNRIVFNHPLFIMFSSGTTGVPKCIVHGHGGTLLQHVKEHRLQCDIKKDDKIFYFTTCGWMMWNWLVSGLASGATLLLYDGSPFYPDGNVLWDYTIKHDCMLFGTAAKYIDALKLQDMHPAKTHDLSKLKAMTSTGSPLVHESFEFVYAEIKADLHLASIAGGTDIVSCFMLGNPISPVWRGELQGPGLGLDVDVFDDNGQSAPIGQSGELVCKNPFPCMPIGFWNDEDGSRYRSAYFETFDNIWAHGDWVEKTPHGGFVIHGRSDATLNPGGVRIGTSEIYRQVEQIPEVIESIAVGQNWQGDVRVILFVILRDGVTLDEALQKTIKTQIRNGASPRHVPAKIIQVTDIPRTKSGKITEIAVRHIIEDRPVKNVEALANPESLELYKDLAELKN